MLKMNELANKSGVSKSTILYYLKEGLLPQPQKLKPNLHLYSEETVEIIGFIGYLQKNFNASISELKEAFSHKDFDIKSPYKSLINILDIIMGADYTNTYTKEQLCDEFDITGQKIDDFAQMGLLYARDGVFTQTEYQMLQIIISSNDEEMKLIQKYLKLSKKISKLEVKLGIEKLQGKDRDLKQLFDIMLILKPYILNMQTLSIYKKEKK